MRKRVSTCKELGLACSRAMVGALTAAQLDGQPDANGTSFLEASTAAGYDGSSHQVGSLTAKPSKAACPVLLTIHRESPRRCSTSMPEKRRMRRSSRVHVALDDLNPAMAANKIPSCQYRTSWTGRC